MQPDRYVRGLVATIERFKNMLDRARIPATVRLTRGRGIEAACGQRAVAR
jgi:adenine C2-methylase RlmN of 23S rRNA A2503 and tRNA A37